MHQYATNERRGPAYALMATLAVVLSVLVDAALGFVARMGVDLPAWLFGAPTVAASFAAVLATYDRWLWRWRLGKLRLGSTPDLRGAYEGTLRSSWNGGMDVPVRLTISQTWSRIQIRFEVTGTTTSTSCSVAAALDRIGDDTAQLSYLYENTVRPGHADEDMSDHKGTVRLDFNLGSGSGEGHYYNARLRRGTITVHRVHSDETGSGPTRQE